MTDEQIEKALECCTDFSKGCKDCALRKWYEIVFDIHFDYKDCPRREKCKKGGNGNGTE